MCSEQEQCSVLFPQKSNLIALLLFQTKKNNNNSFSWDIHFWLGSNTSQVNASFYVRRNCMFYKLLLLPLPPPVSSASSFSSSSPYSFCPPSLLLLLILLFLPLLPTTNNICTLPCLSWHCLSACVVTQKNTVCKFVHLVIYWPQLNLHQMKFFELGGFSFNKLIC